MALDPKIWGPHYWFVLHTIALQLSFTSKCYIEKEIL